MSLWLLIPLLALTAIIQITLLPQIRVIGYKPDLALMLVVSWALLAPVGEAAQWGFIIGMLLDLASGLPFGVNTLALTTIGWLIGWAQATFFRGNIIAPPIATIFATLVHNVLILGILTLLNWQVSWGDYLLRLTLPSAILNALVMPLTYFPLRQYQHRRRPQLEV